jgi:translation initiation factor 2 gamma subunit (eIF-2gamma)
MMGMILKSGPDNRFRLKTASAGSQFHQITSLHAGSKKVEIATPGGLLGVGTKLDPSLTKSDALAGQVAGHIGKLPPVLDRLKFHVRLMNGLLVPQVSLLLSRSSTMSR